jgi:hypothetical protein
MPHTLDRDIRQQLARYLAGDISLAEFTRWFGPVAWQAEESADSDPWLANYAGQIDLRIVEYADNYWNEEELRGLLGPFLGTRQKSNSGTVIRDTIYLEAGTESPTGAPASIFKVVAGHSQPAAIQELGTEPVTVPA